MRITIDIDHQEMGQATRQPRVAAAYGSEAAVAPVATGRPPVPPEVLAAAAASGALDAGPAPAGITDLGATPAPSPFMAATAYLVQQSDLPAGAAPGASAPEVMVSEEAEEG